MDVIVGLFVAVGLGAMLLMMATAGRPNHRR